MPSAVLEREKTWDTSPGIKQRKLWNSTVVQDRRRGGNVIRSQGKLQGQEDGGARKLQADDPEFPRRVRTRPPLLREAACFPPGCDRVTILSVGRAI